MTIYDISKQAGVSIATVSRVLNGSSNVRPKTRKKVLDIIEKCGYTPNAFARGLGLNSMKSIGILCADCSDIYLAKAVYYIEKNLRAGGYHPILCCTGYELDGKKESLSLLLNQHVDSLILVGSHFIEPDMEDNQYICDAAGQVPVMLLNGIIDYPNVYCTVCNDFQAMKDLTLLLLDQGITDILYLYNSHSYSSIKKLNGFRSAYEDKGLTLSEEYLHYYTGMREDVEEISDFVANIHKSGLSFHAIIGAEDILAVGAVKYAKANGFSVPNDFSVMGYNNSLITTCSEPEITSVDNGLEPLCTQLVATCIGVLNGEELPSKTVLPGKIIHRASTHTSK